MCRRTKGLAMKISNILIVFAVLHVGAPNVQRVKSSESNDIVITVNGSEFIAIEGDTWFVQANYSAVPPATSGDWVRGRVPLGDLGGRRSGGNLQEPSLTIRNIMRNESGWYEMLIHNEKGRLYGPDANLTVWYPTCCILNIASIKIATEEESFDIPVSIDALPDPFHIDWLVDGIPVNRSTGRFVNGNLDNPSLGVRAIKRWDEGHYAMTSTNDAGSIVQEECECNIQIIVNYKPEMTCETSRPINVIEGDTTRLAVTVQAKPSVSFLDWLKNNQPVDRTSGRFLGGNATHPNLTIVSIQREDSGVYSVFSNNSVGSNMTCNTVVNVLYAPTVTCWSPTNISVVEFNQFTLNISIQSNPGLSYLEWFKDGKELDRESGRFLNGNITIPSLTAINVQRNDTGLYNVFVNNSIGDVESCYSHVNVLYKPMMECQSGDNLVVSEGSNVQLSVRIQANPPVGYLDWLKDGQIVDRTSGRFQGGNITHPNLTILAIESEDSGRYTVFSNNTAGSQSACNVSVDVQYLPRLTCVSPSNISVEEFSHFTLNVSIQSNPGLSHVEWFKDEEELVRDSGRFQNGNVDIPSLTVVNVQKNDTGLYSIYVNNRVGEVRGCLIHVDVLYLPNITCLANSSITVNETDTFVIPVRVDANPSPSFVDWLKGNDPIDRDSGRFENGDIKEPSLTIKNVQDVDNGTYTIFVNNTLGLVETCRVDVLVNIKPRITINQRNYTVCENVSVTLDCQVFANPAIYNLTWTKDGEFLNTSSPRYDGGTIGVPSLTIKEAVKSDQDFYHCSATNTAGTSTSPAITLDVFTKPLITAYTSQYIATEDTTAVIVCTVVADPRNAVVIWYKNGIKIETTSSRYGNGDVSVPSLTINRVVRDDAGMYVCTAINDVGEKESQEINVTVRYSPSVTVKYNNYGVAKGTSAVLWCEVEALPAVTNLEWRLKDGTPVLPKSNCSDTSPSYNLCNITEPDSGIYQCVATNDVKTSISTDINIYVRDECLINVTDIRLSDGIKEDPVYNGRLEVKVDDVWGTACGKSWTERATQIVCGMFGYSFGVSGMYGAGSGPIHLGHVACNQQDTSLNDCGKAAISNCTHDQDIWLNCSVVVITTSTSTSSTPATTMHPTTFSSANATTMTITVDTSEATQTTTATPIARVCPANIVCAEHHLLTPTILTVGITISLGLLLSVLTNLILLCVCRQNGCCKWARSANMYRQEVPPGNEDGVNGRRTDRLQPVDGEYFEENA